MRWTGLLDLQNGERRLARELVNQLELLLGEGCHHANLNRNWTTSVLLSRDKHNWLCWKTSRRQ